jgi:hypothetical protein
MIIILDLQWAVYKMFKFFSVPFQKFDLNLLYLILRIDNFNKTKLCYFSSVNALPEFLLISINVVSVWPVQSRQCQ